MGSVNANYTSRKQTLKAFKLVLLQQFIHLFQNSAKNNLETQQPHLLETVGKVKIIHKCHF